jgi:hypothetical protein
MNIQEKIELYIEGQMSAEEIQDFEEILQKDVDLAHEVEQNIKLHDMLKKKLKYKSPSLQGFPENELSKTEELSIDDDLDNFLFNYEGEISNEEKKLIQFLENKKKENKVTDSRGIGLYLSIAATITLLLIFSISVKKLVNQHINKNISQTIFSEYYQPSSDPNLLEILPEEVIFQENILIIKANGKKAGAEMSFEFMRSGEETNEELMNLSIIGIQNNELKIASSNLQLLMNVDNEKLALMSQWYYTLLQIKLKNFGTAKEYLKKIEKSNSIYSERAKEILFRLSK